MKINEAIKFLEDDLLISSDQLLYKEYVKQSDRVREVVKLLKTYNTIIELIKNIEGKISN